MNENENPTMEEPTMEEPTMEELDELAEVDKKHTELAKSLQGKALSVLLRKTDSSIHGQTITDLLTLATHLERTAALDGRKENPASALKNGYFLQGLFGG